VEAVFTPYQSPAGAGQATLWPSMGAVEATRTTMAGRNEGRNGLFAESLPDVFAKLWGAQGSGSATLVQWSYALYKMELPTNPVSNKFQFEFDDYAKPAVACLPPVYNASTAPAFEYFIDTWGTSFTMTSTNGGLVQQRSKWASWLPTQRKASTAPGGAPAGFSDHQLAEYAEDDFYDATGLQDPSWSPAKPSADYTAQRSTSAPRCFGGDPGKCTGADLSRTWVPTIAAQPDPITFTFGAIDQLITDDPQTSAAVKAAVDAYVAAQKKAWKKADVCRSCHGAGTCDAKAHESTCTCSSASKIMGLGCEACRYGWQGQSKQCKTPVCNPSCKNGGTCSKPFTCACKGHATGATCSECKSGWTGKGCAEFTCGSKCTKTGNDYRCTGPDECVPVCYGVVGPDLGNGYTCTAPNKIKAPPMGSCGNHNGDDACCGTATYRWQNAGTGSLEICCWGSVQPMYNHGNGMELNKCCAYDACYTGQSFTCPGCPPGWQHAPKFP